MEAEWRTLSFTRESEQAEGPHEMPQCKMQTGGGGGLTRAKSVQPSSAPAQLRCEGQRRERGRRKGDSGARTRATQGNAGNIPREGSREGKRPDACDAGLSN